MDHLRIEEENLVERYLLGQLAAEEAADFEAHYVDCPECLEKLELGRILHRGLREIAAEKGGRTGGGPLRWALAAALLAAVLLPWALLVPAVSRERAERERLAAALAPQGGTAVVALSPERSGPAAEPSTRIALGADPEWVVLALEPPPAPEDVAPRYRVRLLEPEGKLLWQSGPLAPDAAGRVTVGVHSSWLAESVYVLALERLDGEGQFRPAARFAFRVERRR